MTGGREVVVVSVASRIATALAVALVATAAGLVDALAGRAWDLVAVFGLVLAALAVAGAAVRSARGAVILRPDLAQWLRAQAAATGEPARRLGDRAVATYRAGLGTDRDAPP
jgi:hypothetical protein